MKAGSTLKLKFLFIRLFFFIPLDTGNPYLGIYVFIFTL